MLQRVFQILKKYFPENIEYWSETNVGHFQALQEASLYRIDPIPNIWISSEIFYSAAKIVFSGLLGDKQCFLEARKRLVRLLTKSHKEFLANCDAYVPSASSAESINASGSAGAYPSDAAIYSHDSHKEFLAEQKIKTWVVKENGKKPWDLAKVLEELGEVSHPQSSNPSNTSSRMSGKNKRKKSKKQQKTIKNDTQADDTNTKEIPSELGVNDRSESNNCQNDIKMPKLEANTDSECQNDILTDNEEISEAQVSKPKVTADSQFDSHQENDIENDISLLGAACLDPKGNVILFLMINVICKF